MNRTRQTMEQAIFNLEEKKRELEFYQNELAVAEKQHRIIGTSETRFQLRFMERVVMTIKNEVFSAEFTIAEIQWHGEEHPA